MKNTEKLKDRIAQAFASSMGDPEIAREVAFHMTDWDHNVDDLVKLYEHPEAFNDDEILSNSVSSACPKPCGGCKKVGGLRSD